MSIDVNPEICILQQQSLGYIVDISNESNRKCYFFMTIWHCPPDVLFENQIILSKMILLNIVVSDFSSLFNHQMDLFSVLLIFMERINEHQL